MDYKEASKIVADVNDMLQQEIDRIMANEGQEEVRHLEEETLASEVAEEIAPDVEEDDLPEITLPEDLQEFVAEAETAESEVGQTGGSGRRGNAKPGAGRWQRSHSLRSRMWYWPRKRWQNYWMRMS